tara:strand:- start:262 stop:435 length:174 start_codon:yes stop_codon:yes gene_type:complete
MNDKAVKILELIDELFWEYDRLSSDGQENLDELAKLVGLPTMNEGIKQVSLSKGDNK